MRRLAAFAAAVTLVLAAGCEERASCKLPAHCLAAGRVAGACQCTEWEVVATQQVDLPWLVATVVYPLAGDGSHVQYGGQFDAGAQGVVTLSPIGSRWRARVRDADGAEVTARAQAEATTLGGWRLEPVTPATVAFSSIATVTGASLVDVPTHDRDDLLAVWVNPRATVETDFAGSRTVRWTAGPGLEACGAGAVQVVWLTPRQLAGAAPPYEACGAAFLASLDAAARAAIVAHDVFLSPVGGDPQAIFALDRYSTFENTSVTFGRTGRGALAWACPEVLADDALPAHVRTEVPLAGGEALVVEHTDFDTGAACGPHRLAVVETTGTDGCTIETALELDRAFGTAFHVAGTQWDWSGTAACTR